MSAHKQFSRRIFCGSEPVRTECGFVHPCGCTKGYPVNSIPGVSASQQSQASRCHRRQQGDQLGKVDGRSSRHCVTLDAMARQTLRNEAWSIASRDTRRPRAWGACRSQLELLPIGSTERWHQRFGQPILRRTPSVPERSAVFREWTAPIASVGRSSDRKTAERSEIGRAHV